MPAICGDEDPPATLIARAEDVGARLHLIGRDYGYTAGAKLAGINTIVGGQGAIPNLAAGYECDMQGLFNASVLSQCFEIAAYDGITVTVGGRFTANGTGKFIRGWDFSGGTFTEAAIKLGNGAGQILEFFNTGGATPTTIGMDTNNSFNLTNQTGANFFLTTAGSSQYFGTGTPLAGGATTGFVFLPVTTSIPTGTPTGIPSWALPVAIDYNDNKWCIFMNGSWKCVVLA